MRFPATNRVHKCKSSMDTNKKYTLDTLKPAARVMSQDSSSNGGMADPSENSSEFDDEDADCDVID
jgi:hypothetical protein